MSLLWFDWMAIGVLLAGGGWIVVLLCYDHH